MTPIEQLQDRLQQRADPKAKAWWESYLKHAIPFRGVRMADIRALLHEWVRDEGLLNQPTDRQRDVALDLMRLRYCEDKLAGVLYLQEILLPAGAIQWPDDLPRFEALFREGHIFEWNTCDWFCVKLLGPLAEREGKPCALAISGWREADNLWQRRAAGVAFVNMAKMGDANFPGFCSMLLETCAVNVRSPERFAQTGVGWVLRELSHAEPRRVITFVEQHVNLLSGESLSYATARLPAEETARLKQLHRKGQRFSGRGEGKAASASPSFGTARRDASP